MDKIRELLGKPLVTAILGFVLGLIIGLPVLGWGLWPVTWTDAAAKDLRPDLQQEWLKMTIEDYGKTGDATTALARWQELGDKGQTVLNEVMVDPKVDPEMLAKFSSLVNNGSTANLPKATSSGQATATAATEMTATPGATGEATKSGSLLYPTQASTSAPTKESKPSSLPIILLVVFCVLTLIVGGALLYLLVLRKKPGTAGGKTLFPTSHQEAEVNSQAERTDFAAEGQEPPVAQFMTTYMLGDDLYDDSFSIDSPSGEFLGECGVGIAETIGVGDPKKVTAFEVWLFDKNDIQTVTKVLMSEHAFNDAAISQRLASKGEPVVVEPGQRIMLETQTLTLEARVVDMNYGQGALPSGSFFERLTLELAIWPKSSVSA